MGYAGIDIYSGTMPDYVGPENHSTLTRGWKGNIVALWGLEEKIVKTTSGTIYSLDTTPLRDKESIEELKAYCWPAVSWFCYSRMHERISVWKDRYIIASGISVWQHPTFVRGLDVLMLDMLDDPKKAHFLFDTFTSFYCDFFPVFFPWPGSILKRYPWQMIWAHRPGF